MPSITGDRNLEEGKEESFKPIVMCSIFETWLSCQFFCSIKICI